MSDYEDSDFQSEEEVLEDDGENTSDCESVCLGDQILETEDPPGSTLRGDGDIFGEDDVLAEDDDAESEYLPPSLNSTPSFDPIRSPFEPHSAQTYVPSTINRQSPLAFFKLLVSDQEFELFAANTNAYAESKNAIPKPEPSTKKRLPWESRSTPESKRPWHPTSSKEIMSWFGLLIFMGLVKIPRVDLYWRNDGEYSFSPMKQMGLKRFEQLKRYFHLSAPDQGPSSSKSTPQAWYSKIEPFGKAIRDGSSKYFLPATEVSIDEMMVRFTGRSSHTIKIKNKPIKQGFKIFALCWHGFTYTYLYSSRTKKIGGVQKLAAHSLTSSAVIHIATCLPYKKFRFDIYMDNYFTNIPLFAHLRALGIGACGTTRQTSKKYPPQFAKKKASKGKRPVWNTLEGEIIDGVLALIWMDNNYVLLLTTIHQVKGKENYTWCVRRRPGLSSTNAKIVRPVFGDQQTKRLLIPVIINMYNFFMGGVDIADQRRSYWPTQLRVCRNWLPLFFWCLDTAIVNAFLLYRTANLIDAIFAKNILDHRQFREKLYQELLAEGSYLPFTTNSYGSKPLAISRRTNPGRIPKLSATRHQLGHHEKVKLERKGYCSYCMWLRKQEMSKGDLNRTFGAVIVNSLVQQDSEGKKPRKIASKGLGKRAKQTRMFCSLCQTFICDECFDLYHSKE